MSQDLVIAIKCGQIEFKTQVFTPCCSGREVGELCSFKPGRRDGHGGGRGSLDELDGLGPVLAPSGRTLGWPWRLRMTLVPPLGFPFVQFIQVKNKTVAWCQTMVMFLLGIVGCVSEMEVIFLDGKFMENAPTPLAGIHAFLGN